MSYSPMDLDSSLDDLIKKRKANKSNNNKKDKQPNRSPIQTNKTKITKNTPRSNDKTKSKQTIKKLGPLFTAKNKQQQQQQKPQPQQQQKKSNQQPQQPKADPSKIIITKNIASSTLLSRIGPSTDKTAAKAVVPQDSNAPKVRGRLAKSTLSMIPMEQRDPQPMRTNNIYKESNNRYDDRYEERNSRYDDRYEERNSRYDTRDSRYEERPSLYNGGTLRTETRYDERPSIFGGSSLRTETRYDERPSIFGGSSLRTESRYEERPGIFGGSQRVNSRYEANNRYDERPAGGFRIRGLSNTVEPSTPVTYRSDLGPPTKVLVTGLDEYTNATDVRMFLDGFGEILECEILKNRAGQSFGEAEVVFDSKAAALECIAKLDNQMADGHFLRIVLREPKPSLRSAIATTPTSGRLYSDRVNSRYDIHRQ